MHELDLIVEPRSELSSIFYSNDIAFDYIILTKRLETVLGCVLCGAEMHIYKYKDKLNSRMFQCINKSCKAKRSLFKNLPISSPQIELRLYIFSIYKWVENCPEKDVLRNGQLSKFAFQSIKKHIHRYIEYKKNLHCTVKLGGANTSIQIDETAISHGQLIKNPSTMEDDSKGIVWLVGLIEENSRKFYYEIVPNRKKETMKQLIIKYVKEKTTIITDGHPSYPFAVQGIEGNHVIVNHSLGFRNSEGFTTNNIENLWSLLKYEVKKRRGIKFCNLEVFLNEFWFRYNFLSQQTTEEINDSFNEILDFLFNKLG